MSEVSLKPIIESLESLFDKLNEHFYSSELMTPVISISPNRVGGVYGWCTSWKAWRDRADDDSTEQITEGYYEINICAEYLARPFEQIAETMLHEMVHLYNLSQNIRDTGSNGKYHNKIFRDVAESHGLLTARDKRYGWCYTQLTDESEMFIKSLNGADFQLYRYSPSTSRRKQTYRRYVCPKCGTIVRATKVVRILCGYCYMVFREEA